MRSTELRGTASWSVLNCQVAGSGDTAWEGRRGCSLYFIRAKKQMLCSNRCVRLSIGSEFGAGHLLGGSPNCVALRKSYSLSDV